METQLHYIVTLLTLNGLNFERGNSDTKIID